MATPTTPYLSSTHSSADSSGLRRSERLNKGAKDQESKNKSLDIGTNFQATTQSESGPHKHSSDNNSSNMEEEKTQGDHNETMMIKEDNHEKNIEKMGPMTQVDKHEENTKEIKKVEEGEKKLNEKEGKINELQHQLEEAQMAKEEAEKKLNEKEGNINELQHQLEEAQMAKEEAEKKLNEKEGNINELQHQLLEEAQMVKEEAEKKLNEKEGNINELQHQLEEAHKAKEEAEKKRHVFIVTAIVGLVAVLIALSLAFKGHEENIYELRLMLVGKTGAGKSASGNTILGETAFKVEASPASVTGKCEKRNKFIDGRNITIIDTPGVMDTWLTSEQMAQTAPECTFIFRPGPHVFLLVIRLGRFTQEEMNAVKWIQENFGEEALKFTLILFTGGDLLERKPVEKFISNSIELQSLVDTCQGRYHVFNNYEQSNHTQVTQLFEKINQILHENMGYIYSKELYQYVKQNIQKEEETKRMILESKIQQCNNLMAENREKEEVKRKNLEEDLKEERMKMNKMSNRQREEIATLEKEKNQCKRLVAEITEREEVKRKELEEECKKEERKKMNKIALKLRDEQSENIKLKTELDTQYVWLQRALLGAIVFIVLCLLLWFYKNTG